MKTISHVALLVGLGICLNTLPALADVESEDSTQAEMPGGAAGLGKRLMDSITGNAPPKPKKEEPQDPNFTKSMYEFNLIASEKADYTAEGSSIRLRDGTILVHAKTPLVISTSNGALFHMSKRSMALIRSRPGADRYMLLLEKAKLFVDKHLVNLSAGEEALVTAKAPVARTIGEDGIGRRRIKLQELKTGTSVAVSEFSILQTIEKESLFDNINKAESGDAKGLRERLLKTAAVLNAVTGRHGSYSPMGR